MDQGREEEFKDFHLQPSAWNAERGQEPWVPSKEIKLAANRLVWCEQAQQSMGWLLLTQMGVLLGSFGQLMSQAVCLLSWGIFILEAILKYGRGWALSLYFGGVPCAIVALHDNTPDTASTFLRVFGRFVLIATLLEVLQYAFYIRYTVTFLRANRDCYDKGAGCPDGTTNLMNMLIISMVIVCVHLASSLVTVLAFRNAMGMGFSARARARDSNSWFRHLSPFVRKREERDRLMCLTWWVHMARHGQLKAVVASAQDSDCGLPGHWFKSKEELFRIVEECDKGDHVHLDTSRLLWVSQEMALRALISLAKQEKLGRVDDKAFALLVRVVRDGRTESCRGLAATAIAVLATQPDVLPLNSLIEAVEPLKRLARSEAVEHVEVALGALLNASIFGGHRTSRNSPNVIDLILDSNILDRNEVGSSFMSCLIRHAHIGKSTLCQELAVRLLSHMVRERKPAREALRWYMCEQGGVPDVQLCTALIKHGETPSIKAGGAAVLAEIAYWEDWEIRGSDPHIEECIQALVKALKSTTSKLIIVSAAKALCSLAYNNQDVKATIVRAEGIPSLVDLLKAPLPDSGPNDINGQISPATARCNLHSDLSFVDLGRMIPREEDNRSTVTPLKPHLEEDVRSDDVRLDAAKALRILALNNPELQKRIADAKAIPLLIKLMASKDPKLQVQAMASLFGLSFENPNIKDMISECENGKIFSSLMNVLKSNEGHDPMAEAILEKVAHLTISLFEGNNSNWQKAVKQSMRDKLRDCIYRGNYRKNGEAIQSAEEACKILSGNN